MRVNGENFLLFVMRESSDGDILGSEMRNIMRWLKLIFAEQDENNFNETNVLSDYFYSAVPVVSSHC